MGEHISQYYDLLAHAYKYARMLMWMHTIFWHAWPHILAQLVQIKDIDVSIVAEGQPSQDYDIFAHACKHAHVQEHFFCQ